MDKSLIQKINIISSGEVLIREVALHIAGIANSILGEKDYFDFALSGSETPKPLYRMLSSQYRKIIPWERVRIFWGDERFVPHDSPESNYRTAKETLLLDLPIPSENIFPIPTSQSTPEDAALFYEALLKSQFDTIPPRLDLILLGIGSNCHTASLFPGLSGIEESERLIIATKNPETSQNRISMTFRTINNAKNIYFLITGAEKAEAFKRAASDPPNPSQCPASGVHPIDGELTWWADLDAGRLISPI